MQRGSISLEVPASVRSILSWPFAMVLADVVSSELMCRNGRPFSVWHLNLPHRQLRLRTAANGVANLTPLNHAVRRFLFSDIFIPAKSRNIFHFRKNVCGANILSPFLMLATVFNCATWRAPWIWIWIVPWHKIEIVVRRTA